MVPALSARWRGACVAAVLLLAGCSSNENTFTPVCPELSLLSDAADLVRFTGPPGATPDARRLALTARISAVPAKCGNIGPTKVQAKLNVAAQVRRGPAAVGDSAQIPYFVAITEGDKVLVERDFVLTAKFRSNADQVAVNGEEIDLTLPVNKTRTAVAYHIYVGFRLTETELAYNRAQAAH